MNKKVASVGIVGMGFIGSAITRVFSEYTKVYCYDIAKEYDNYTKVIEQPIIFVCLPTPMLPDGNVDTSTVQGAFEKLAKNLPDDHCPIVVLKSTVPPDALLNWHVQFSDHFTLVFSPEFLTERTAQLDMQQANRHIFGFTSDSSVLTFDVPNELQDLHDLFDARYPCVPFYYTSYQQASLVKYFTNVFFATKLSLFNEYYEMCMNYNLSYDQVIGLTMMDQRIGRSHFKIPGPDGQTGWSGSCFPKDIQGFTRLAESMGASCEMAKAAWNVNLQMRPSKDWEKLVGRAVSANKDQ